MKDFTMTIAGRFAGLYNTEIEALNGIRNVIKPGEIAHLYHEVPHSHKIAELTYEDVQAATEVT